MPSADRTRVLPLRLSPALTLLLQPIAEWKQKVLAKKQAKTEAEIAMQRAEEAAKEARWIGVPAWKRAIIEKKEAALNE